MKLSRDIQSLSEFKRDSAKMLRQLKKTGEPIISAIIAVKIVFIKSLLRD